MRKPSLKAGFAIAALIVVASASAAVLSDDSTTRTGPDCSGYVFPAAEWRQLRPARRPPVHPPQEERRRALIDDLTRCELLLGETQSDVVELLGRPSRKDRDNNPRPHEEWTYFVGTIDGELLSETEASLFMEFDKGRVAYVQAPEAGVGDSGEGRVNGQPVGGGPR